MAQITGNNKRRKEVPEKNKPTQRQINIKNHEEYAILLESGECLRADGIFVYRPLKKEYEGVLNEAPKPIYASSLEALREKEAKFRADIKNYRTNCNSAITVAQAYDRWISLKRNVQENTLRNYIYAFENHVRRSKLGRSCVINVRKSDVMAFYSGLADKHIMCFDTMNTIQSVLSQVFRFCIDDRIIPAPSPTEGALDHLRRKRSFTLANKRGALTLAEQYTFFTFLQNSTPDRKWLRLFTVLLGTGMRIGELLALQWDNVDFENNIIHVRHNIVYFPHQQTTDKNGTKCYYEIHDLKTRASHRVIPMFGFVKALLLEEKQIQEKAGTHCICPVVGEDGRVYQNFCFLNRFQKPHTANTLTERVLGRLIRDCNCMTAEGKIKDGVMVPMFGCHVLRHTAATRLIELGVSPIVVQAFLGHADVSTTMNIYVSVTEGFKLREFGMDKEVKRQNLFEEALRENGVLPESKIAVVQNFLPQSPTAALLPTIQKP